jgi:methionyl aminopeptidase
MIKIKSADQLKKMCAAGKVVADTLSEIAANTLPGMTTLDLDDIAVYMLKKHGAISSFKGYRGFPNSICASINEEVVHGIPGPKKLMEGDIISIDFGAIVDGYHGDSAITIPVGEISQEAQKLIRVTQESLFAGIKMAVAGNRLSDVSNAIQQYAEKHNFSVVRDLVGHGIGQDMHEDPQIPNFGKPGYGPILKPGMTLAIEPMINVGKYDVDQLSDHWTVVTKDGSLSAHFEHTVAVTENGPEILTLRQEEK